MKQLLLVFLGGGMGSALRYIISKYLNANLPYGTFTVNIVGCFIIGFLLTYVSKSNFLSENQILLLTVGLCCCFSTIYAVTFKKFLFLKKVDSLYYIFYTLSSLIIGVLTFFAGIWLFNLLFNS